MAQTYSGEVAYVGSKAAGKGTAYFFYVKGIQNLSLIHISEPTRPY